jgi:hypothetical protein
MFRSQRGRWIADAPDGRFARYMSQIVDQPAALVARGNVRLDSIVVGL